MLLSTGNPPTGASVVVEPKFDGVRSVVTLHDGRLTILSRRSHDVTECYPELAELPARLIGRSAVFDGEIIAVNDRGLCDFQRLQRRMNRRNPSAAHLADTPVYFVVFDLLWLDGVDLSSRPLSERRRTLEVLLDEPGRWQVVKRLEGAPSELMDTLAEIGLEGLVVKADGPYRPGQRHRDWVKLKCRKKTTAVIGGIAKLRSPRIGALAVGAYHDDRLHYIGQVGLSLPHGQADQLERFLKRIRTSESPFHDLASKDVTFVDPHVVVEISYSEVTEAGTLRQPVLIAVRPDVMAHTVTLDSNLAHIARRNELVKLGARQAL
jgi:bifunctional non-homologous end joining protein LigD